MEKLLNMLRLYEEGDDELVEQIRNQLERVCIPIQWDRILHLRRYGYRVFPFDYDHRGWLIGAVQTKKGLILFG